MFDTVITRAVAFPRGVFGAMQEALAGREGIPPELAADFARCRVQAERAARRPFAHGEATLAEIYEELSRRHGLSAAQAAAIADEELRFELSFTRGVPETAARIRRLRAEGKRVVFLSDMYLPSAFIGRLIENAGVEAPPDDIYVSCEHRTSKRGGGLFRKMLEKEGCRPGEVLHVGDTPEADVLPALAAGIHARHFTACRLNRYERAWAPAAETDGGFRSEAAAASRLARLDLHALDGPAKTLAEIAASLPAPALVECVCWMLERARREGVRRLYFLSRDGKVLLRIAEKIKAHLGLDIDLRYLYVSRQAVTAASLTDVDDAAVRLLALPSPVLTLSILARRTGLEEGEVVRDFAAFHGKSVAAGAELTLNEAASVQAFLVSGSFRQKLLARAARLRESAAAYLRQEGLLDGVPWGLADLGWRGTIQSAIERILSLEAGRSVPVRGYYLGLRVSSEPGRLDSFLFDRDALRQGPDVINLMELLCSTDQGTVSGYERDAGGRSVPVFGSFDPERFRKLGLDGLAAGVDAYISRFPWQRLNEAPAADDCRRRFFAAAGLLTRDPSAAEAAAIGDCLFSSEQAEARLVPYAPALQPGFFFKETVRFWLSKPVRWGGRLYGSYWIEGSIARSGLSVRKAYQALQFLRRLKSRLR